MQQKNKLLRLRLIVSMLILLIAVTIFLLSNQPASESKQLSMGVSEQAYTFYKNLTHNAEITLREWDSKVRKLAHAFIFFVLASMLMLLCYTFRLSYRKSVVVTFLCSVLFAATDEFHQYFVQGRGPSITDVGIDSIGILCAVGFMYVVFRRRKRE